MVLGVRFCMEFINADQGVFFDVFGTLGPWFPCLFLLLSSSSFFFPLSSLGAGLGSLFFSSVFLPTGPQRLVEAGPA